MKENIWRPSFEDAWHLSKKLLKEHPISLLVLFLLGFWVDMTLESPFAAPQAAVDDQLMILIRVTQVAWELLVSILLFMLSTLPTIPAPLMAGQRPARWDRETWTLMASETLRSLAKVLLWTLLFVIPGIIQYVRLSFVPYVVLYSEKYRAGDVDALELSKKLAKPVLWSLLFLSMGLSLVAFGIQMIPQIDVSLRVIYIRSFFELAAFLIAVYACCLMRTLFHRLLVKISGDSQ